MFSCPLCDDWLYVRSLCDQCKRTKNIVLCYGIDHVNKILEDVFLRESDKVSNKADMQKSILEKDTALTKAE